MTEIILKTGWKHWDMYLSKFVGKKVNCLDIGSYTGESTCWMLNNLCTNPYSKVFSVDTWEGSAEYTNYTNEIEKKFDEAINNTGRKDQHVKMKMTSSNALLKLKEFGYIIFDFIFIDASHEAKDVVTDAILSWDILNEEGILIFDDYKWDKLKEEHFRPKLAIDSFVQMFKPQLKTLYIGYQYIIEKIQIRDYDKPELTDYYKLVDRINRYKYENFEYIYEDVINEEIEYKLEMSNILNEEIKIVPQINKNFSNYEIMAKIFKLKNSYWINSILDNSFNNKIINTIISKLNIYKYNLLYLYYINKHLYKYIKSINKNNINIYMNLTIYNTKIFYKTFKSINTKYKIKLTLNDLIIDNNIIYNKLITSVNKYEYILFGYIHDLNGDDCFNKIKYVSLIIYVALALNIQKEDGILIIYVPYFISYKIVNESMYLLKKYYKKVNLNNVNTTNIGSQFVIICENFITINDSEKNIINNLINNIYININNNNNYINSLLLNIKYNNDIKLIFNNKFNKIIETLKLYNDIYLYNGNKQIRLHTFFFQKIITNLLYNII